MSEEICSELISAAIGVLTIISSAIFLFINIRVNRSEVKREVQRKVFSNFYLPLRFKLGYMNNVISMNANIDIFVKKEEDALYTKKREGILLLYKEFLEWISKQQYCYSKNIDKEIFKIVEHMQFVLVYNDDVDYLNEHKEEYLMPNIVNIIGKIDKEFEKGKMI